MPRSQELLKMPNQQINQIAIELVRRNEPVTHSTAIRGINEKLEEIEKKQNELPIKSKEHFSLVKEGVLWEEARKQLELLKEVHGD